MFKHALAAGLAVFLFAPAALAANATVTGPLGDGQLVRGKKLGMTYLHYGANGADPSASVTVHYGFNGSLTATAPMSPTGYGNQVAFLDVPANASGFVYELQVSDGSVQNNAGAPFALDVRDRAVSVSKVNGSLSVRYAGFVSTTYDTFLHVGWNDWNNVSDVFMARTEYSYGKAGQYIDYNGATIDAPWWASYLDFVVYDQRNGGTWDNNGGADFHNSLHPFVQTSVTNNGAGTLSVNVFYADGDLNPPALHYGLDGWSGVTDLNMGATNGGWSAYFAVPASAGTLNFAFFNGSAWNNNYGMNWNVALH